MDSTEHVTDFQSASDHTMTLKKFQELNMPISVPTARAYDKNILARQPKSVFEEEGDVTAIEPAQEQSIENKRWKFKGPWLAGMTDGEFSKWLEKNVRTRRAEFRAYLRERYAEELTKAQTKQAEEAKLPVPPEIKANEITELQFIDYLKDIRQDRLDLFRHVRRFLDLAPLAKEMQYISTVRVDRPQIFDRENPYSTVGPPITHPSAGLSYLRTPHFMDNHPIYGPQKYHPVVKARVLKPANHVLGVHEPVIGVAGFVTERPTDQRMLGRAAWSSRGTAASWLDLEARGGTKLYYKLDSATIDSSGRVRLSISDAVNATMEDVAKEMLGDDGVKSELYMDAIGDSLTPDALRYPKNRPLQKRTHIYGSRQSYGFGQDKEERL